MIYWLLIPLIVYLDLKGLPDGATPGVFRIPATKEAGFTVTSEVPGVHGPKCLKCTDRKGMAKSFYPYLQYLPRSLKQGQITFTFAVRQPEKSPARLHVELRGRGGTGPSIEIGRDGVVKANGKQVATLKPGEWTRFELRFALGGSGPGTYKLKVHGPSGEATHTLPFGSKDFDAITWIGIVTPDDADGTAYLDGLKLEIAE